MDETRPTDFAQRLPSIDLLRGAAIFWVIAYHLLADTRGVRPVDEYYADLGGALRDLQLWDTTTAIFTLVLRLGYQGVPLFMMVSGFGMMLNAERRDSTIREHARALPRRLRALLVPYWIGFVLTVIAMYALALVRAGVDGTSIVDEFTEGARISNLPYDVDAGALIAGLTLVPRGLDWHWTLAPSPSLWFVFLFAQFYIAFPLLRAAFSRIGVWWFLAAAFAVTLLARAPLVLSDQGYGLIFHWWIDAVYLPFNLASFALGMAAGWLFVHDRSRCERWTGGSLAAITLIYAGLMVQGVGSIASVRAGAAGLVGGPMISLGLALLSAPLLALGVRPLVNRRLPAALAAAGTMSFAWLIASDPLRFAVGTLHALDAPAVGWTIFGLMYAPLLGLLALGVDRLSRRLVGPAAPAPPTPSTLPGSLTEVPSRAVR